MFICLLSISFWRHTYNFFLNWNIVNVQYFVSFRSITKWFDIFIHYEIITTISLTTICPHRIIIILMTIFFMLYIMPRWLISFKTGDLYLIIPFSYFPPMTPLSTTFLFSISKNVLYNFFLFVLFLDSTYKCDHMVLVFLWLILLSIIHSRFICVVTNG